MRVILAIMMLVWSVVASAADFKATLQSAIDNPNNADSFAALTAMLPRVSLPSGSSVYVVEGDLLLSEEQLREYLREQRARGRVDGGGSRNPELKVNIRADGGRDYYESSTLR